MKLDLEAIRERSVKVDCLEPLVCGGIRCLACSTKTDIPSLIAEIERLRDILERHKNILELLQGPPLFGSL